MMLSIISALKFIREKKTKCIFLSPHLDDAIFSCGGLLSYLSSHTSVEIVTVFSEGGIEPYTFYARRYLKRVGYLKAGILFQERKKEDQKAAKNLKIKYRHLNFIDAAWRKDQSTNFIKDLFAKILPEINHFYPLGRNVFSGRISTEDSSVQRKIEKEFKKIIRENTQAIFFSPIAIGNHVDHVIVKKLASQIFVKIIYWSDYPYCLQQQADPVFIKNNQLEQYIFTNKFQNKKVLLNFYKSQIKAEFADSQPPLIPEMYFMNRAVLETQF